MGATKPKGLNRISPKNWVRLPMPLIILFGNCELEYLVNHISADTLTTGRTNNPSADRLGLGLWCLMPLSTIFQ